MVKSKIKKNYLFVYGTLRKDEGLNFFIDRLKLNFIGIGKLHGYDMYFKFRGYPVVIKGKGILTGEIYELPSDALELKLFLNFLDNVEREYNRKLLDIKIKDKKYKCFTYVYKFPELVIQDKFKTLYSKIKSGDWKKR